MTDACHKTRIDPRALVTGLISQALAACLLVLMMTGCGGGGQSEHHELFQELADLGARLEYDDSGSVVFVNLSGTEADNTIVSTLTQVESIEKLWVDDTNITDEGLEAIGQMKQLRYLVLTDTYVSNRGLAHLESLDNLRELYLSGTRVTQTGVVSFQEKKPGVSIIY